MANQTVNEMEADLGAKLKRLRLNKNLDQKTLAARAGVSVRALRNLESGAGTTVKTLLSVLRALGRETWLDTVAPVATINPLTLTSRIALRQRAARRRAFSPNSIFKTAVSLQPTAAENAPTNSSAPAQTPEDK
jgi:transcriptional regulator with XRE-family HTH domain